MGEPTGVGAFHRCATYMSGIKYSNKNNYIKIFSETSMYYLLVVGEEFKSYTVQNLVDNLRFRR